MDIQIKRVYDPPSPDDGHRILVDRFWPRGMTKDKVQAERWMKEAAPGAELCKWFGHDHEKWEAFKQRYHAELSANPGAVQQLRELAASARLTLLYSARDDEYNQAVALREYLLAQE